MTARKPLVIVSGVQKELPSGDVVGETSGGTGQTSFATGDLLYASGTDTLAKLAGNLSTTPKYLGQVGNGTTPGAPTWNDFHADVYTVIAAEAQAFKYRNLFANGSFRVWDTANGQTSFTSSGYTCAQTSMSIGSGGSPVLTVSRQTWTLGDSNNIYNTRYYLQAAQSAAATTQAPLPVRAYLESVRSTGGKTVFVRVRASCASGTVVVTPLFKQNFGTGGSPSSDVNTASTPSTITLTTTPTDFDLGFSVPSISGKTLGSNNNDYAAVLFQTPLSATYTTNWYNLQVGLDPAVIIPAVDGEDEVRCLRYYETLGGTSSTDIIASMKATAGGDTFDIPTKFYPKRALGTATIFGTWNVTNCGQPTARAPGISSFSYYIVATGSGIVQVYTDASTKYIEINARYPL